MNFTQGTLQNQTGETMHRKSPILLFLACILSIALPALTQPAPVAKHAFTAKDWATLRSANAAAVSPDSTILYTVPCGAEKGPTHREGWTIAPDGSHATKLDLKDDFTPLGFTYNGHALYSGWPVKNLNQFAIFPIKDGKAAPSLPPWSSYPAASSPQRPRPRERSLPSPPIPARQTPSTIRAMLPSPTKPASTSSMRMAPAARGGAPHEPIFPEDWKA
jgi:hypothetical protein